MGLMDKMMGNASANDASDLVNGYLSDGESVIKSFKIWRDEIAVTNFGFYIADSQGVTGKKKSIQYVAKKDLVGINFDNNYGLARDCKVTFITRSVGSINVDVKKADSNLVIELIKEVKELINE